MFKSKPNSDQFESVRSIDAPIELNPIVKTANKIDRKAVLSANTESKHTETLNKTDESINVNGNTDIRNRITGKSKEIFSKLKDIFK